MYSLGNISYLPYDQNQGNQACEDHQSEGINKKGTACPFLFLLTHGK
jgi:hypothetical protein